MLHLPYKNWKMQQLAFLTLKLQGVTFLPIEISKKYRETLLPALLNTFNEAFSMGQLLDSMGEAIIVVIPKKDKNPLYPESQRPISLLSTDVKIHVKVPAISLNKVIQHIIHSDQAGFMPNMSTGGLAT